MAAPHLLRCVQEEFTMSSVSVPSSRPTPLRRLTPGLALAAALAALSLALVPSLVQAGPVVALGSGYSLALTQSTTADGFALNTLRFDGVAETFVHRSDGPVSVTVQELQTELGGGRHAIDIELGFWGGDPFPSTGTGAAVGIGSITAGSALDGLDLADAVALTAFRSPRLPATATRSSSTPSPTPVS